MRSFSFLSTYLLPLYLFQSAGKKIGFRIAFGNFTLDFILVFSFEYRTTDAVFFNKTIDAVRYMKQLYKKQD